MEYHRTKDILHVKQLLGHKFIQSTMKYTQLISFDSDEFTCRVAENLKEASELIENGFEFVTDMDSKKLFRKPKQALSECPPVSGGIVDGAAGI